MDPSGASKSSGTGKRSSSPSSGTMGAKGAPAQSSQRPRVKITPFHSSPILSSDGALRSKRTGFFLGTPGHMPAPPAKERLSGASAAGISPSSGSTVSSGEKGKPCPPVVKPAGKKTPKSNATKPQKSGPPSKPEPKPSKKKDKIPTSSSTKPQSAAKKRKRKMGLYNLVPKKKAKSLKQQEKKEDLVDNQAQNGAAAEEKIVKSPETSNVIRTDSLVEEELGAGSHVEYTELALDCLDLKAQEELLSPSLSGVSSGAEVTETELAEELPLCCCRMETPHTGGSLSTPDQTCMAMESIDEMLIRCQRRVMKQEMMRPSNTVHLMILCEDHRAGMVKHQCCPGCGLFCRTGTFMECRPYGSISHRFHHDCASILKNLKFCPHCGEDASGAKEVTIPKADPSPSVPRSHPGPSLPAVPTVATLPSVSNTPAVPQVLRAKKTVEPPRGKDNSPSRLKSEAVCAADKLPKESLESILMALDDENLKPKKVKYPARQLYISAKQGELKKVIHLLVDGRDPNIMMEGQNKCTPLYAAAAEGHQEICHMLVQAGANLDMFDEEQKTPLMAACENNHLDTVKYLLRAGASVSHKDIMGFTCLHLAAKLGHYDILHLLLSKASKYINSQDDGGWTPITWAIEYKHKELVHLLLSKGADVNMRDKEENVCLHWAALSGCDDVAQALLEARCDLSAINIHGDSPLHVAARENHLECVMLFLSRGADVNQRNKEGEMPLDCCIHGSKVWTALNANKKLTDARRGRDCQGERVLSRDISRGYEAIPITCVNGVDSEPCPENFKYIPDSCVTSPLNIDKDITHLQHCGCTDDCSSSTCVCGQLSLRCWYDSEGRLPLDFCQREPPSLFECNHACSCWRTCRNRVVQNGLRVRLQLFRTPKMGWGVRALQDIPQGTFICEYVGEIITDAEADKRENDSFLFTLDNKVGDVHCIDARLFGNIGRFINHLCEPNLLAVRVFTMHQDLRFPRIAFFSSKSIKAGDQIGFDYGDHYWRVKSKFFSCHCGSLKCRHLAASR
ncbi:histone-lysine N-methyltransferase EHMT1a [Cheilinus undulatus]|uniref:histone-lysine N-methyltransferase EHMT1a n=1 Tax=Cheilinus undulatus TaxID=241271 RepID=UPI001BD61700|nr:histone-lysine N-methyltransferase EHMT1a [Cheilinus undulatus]XP_041644378.1 histone-lysine N-methyltransferase EHMT1a [Cheilinus undulatus]